MALLGPALRTAPCRERDGTNGSGRVALHQRSQNVAPERAGARRASPLGHTDAIGECAYTW